MSCASSSRQKFTPRAGQFGLETLSNWMTILPRSFYDKPSCQLFSKKKVTDSFKYRTFLQNMRPLCLAVLLLFSGTQESDSLYIMSIVLNIMISPDDGVGSYKPKQNGTDMTDSCDTVDDDFR